MTPGAIGRFWNRFMSADQAAESMTRGCCATDATTAATDAADTGDDGCC